MLNIITKASVLAVTAAITLNSDPICNSAGCTQYLHPGNKLPYKINYFVPNFGQDTEINQNKDSLKIAEAQLGHKLGFPYGNGTRKIVEYPKNLPYDEDIVDSQANLKSAEKVLDHKWDIVKEVFKG